MAGKSGTVGRNVAFVSLLFLLLLTGIPIAWLWADSIFGDAYGGTPQIATCSATAANPYEWIALSFVALMLGLMIAAGMRVFSGVLDSPKLNDYVKTTTWGFIEGVGLLTIFSLAFAGLQEYGIANINTARAYSVIIRNTAIKEFSMVLTGSTMISMFTSFSPNFRLPGTAKLGIPISFQISPIFRPIFDALGMLMQMLTLSVISWFGHEFLLCSIKDSMLVILVPAGLFLRSYGLRGGGNALIGIALALYFVYPFMLIQIGESVTAHVSNEIKSMSLPDYPGCFNQPICCTFPGTASSGELSIPNGNSQISVEKVLSIGSGTVCWYGTMSGRVFQVLDGTYKGLGLGTAIEIGAIYGMVKALNLSILAPFFLVTAMTFVQSMMYDTIYLLFIVSILLPIFVIFITITLAKEIAKALGTEIDLTSLEKII